MRVDDDSLAIVELDPELAEAETFGVRNAPDSDENHIEARGLGGAAAGRLERHLDVRARGVDACHLGAELEHDALLGQDALKLLRHLAVETRRYAIEHFNNSDLRAKAPPDRAELKTDISGADDEHALRHFRQRQRSGGGDNALLVDLHAWNARDLGAGGDDDILGFERLFRAIGACYLDLAGRGDAGLAVDRIDLVFLEQEIDALNVALHRLVLEGEHGGEVELRFHLDAEMAEIVSGFGETLRGVEQRFRGYAADIETGAAVGGALLDDCDFHSKLGRADGADIAAGAGADDDEIVLH